MASEHTPRFQRYTRGMTAIRPQRPLYGYRVYCSCGWELRVNATKREATKLHNEHRRQEKNK